MTTQAERNAALLAAHDEALKIITHFVPAMFIGYAASYLNLHPELIRNVSDACLNAAERVRNATPEVATPPIGVNIPVPPSPPSTPKVTS